MLNDQLARDRIVNELDTTFLVEAGAGSGKTTSLVARMAALIETGKAEAGQIAAITFTRKAADELKSRFRLELEKRLKLSGEAVKGKLQQAIEDLDRCFIGTIHSFCGQLLRERPIEAKLDPFFRELEEEEALEFRKQCWDEYIQELLLNGQEQAIDTITTQRVNVEDLQEVYLRVGGYTDVEIDTPHAPRPDFDLIRLSLPRMIEDAFPFIPASKPEKGWDALQQMIRDGRRTISLYGLDDDMRVLDLAKRFEREINVTQNRWTDTVTAKGFKEHFLEWQSRVLSPFLRSWREHLYPELIGFVQPALEYCSRRRNEMGLLDFQDLLMRAARLLREHTAVRAFFAGRYHRLFVDEFQDTDPIQAEMMLLLSGNDAAEANWRMAVPRPGSLFVVGDPKQSIYRFRRADISTYNFVKNRIRGCGDVLQLNANFRSVHALGRFVNYEFNSRFPQTETEHQAAFVKMETQWEDPGRNALHGVFTLTCAEIKGGKAAIAELDSDRIARLIAWACSGHLNIQEKDTATGQPVFRDAVPADFMILLKRREFLHLYAEKLERYGIQADTSGSSVKYEEVSAVAILAKCLNDPSDKIALLAVLRGMLFGVSDNALFHYKMEGHPFAFTYLPEREQVLAAAYPVYRVLERLAVYSHWVRKLPALSAFHKIAEDLGMFSHAANGVNGSNRAGTLIKLLHNFQQDLSSSAGWPELTLRLTKLTSDDGELEGTGLFGGMGQAVRIMNLHKAKGLEAHCVILACPCGDSDHDASEHVDRTADPGRGYFTITRRLGFQTDMIAHPQGWLELSERERQFMNAEKERLLYVAATRAKQMLVVSRYPHRPQIDPWSSFESSLLDAQELDDFPVDEVMAEIYDADHDEAADEAYSREQRKQLAEPTYQVRTVTEMSKSGAAPPPRPAEGRGMAFGSTVHRCIELLGMGKAPEDMELEIGRIAEEESLDAKFLPDVISTLTEVHGHELWKRSQRAKHRLHELPFMSGQAASIGQPEMLLKGVIDFLFEEEDGWVVVDFKTDLFVPAHEQLFIDYYKPQVRAYVEELESSFGFKIKEAGLYFLAANKYAVV